MDSLDEVAKERGGYAALARELGVARQTLYKWRQKVPLDRVVEIERLTGIPRSKLRPDIFNFSP